MAVNILVIDERGEKLSFHGFIDEDIDYFPLIEKAKEKNMKMIPFIAHTFNTIFNENQIKVLKKEVALLRSEPVINPKVLDAIASAILVTEQSEHYYIKFLGD